MTRYNVSRFCCIDGHCSLCAGGGILANRERVRQALDVPDDIARKTALEFMDYDPYVYEIGEPDPFYAADQSEATEEALTLFVALVDAILKKRGTLLALTTDVSPEGETWYQIWEMNTPKSDYTECKSKQYDKSPNLSEMIHKIAKAEGVTL